MIWFCMVMNFSFVRLSGMLTLKTGILPLSEI